jgi:hypothetical protein
MQHDKSSKAPLSRRGGRQDSRAPEVSRRRLLRYLAPGALAAGAVAVVARPAAAAATDSPTLQSITGWASVEDYGGDKTGSTDSSAAFAAAAATGAPLFVPPGRWLLDGAQPVVLAAAGQEIRGSGAGVTQIIVGSGVRGQAVACTGRATGVRDLLFSGASGSTADAVALCGQASAVSGLWFEGLGGWMVRVQDCMGARISHCASNVTCAGGVTVQGPSGGTTMQVMLSDLNLQQVGRLGAFLFENAFDIQAVNLNAAVLDTSGASTLAITGNCATIQLVNSDLGVYPNGSGNTAVIEIDGGTDIRFLGGCAQDGANGLRMTGGSRVLFSGVRFFRNFGIGALASGGSVTFADCEWDGNGRSGGTWYDLAVTGATSATVRGYSGLSKKPYIGAQAHVTLVP